MTRGAWGSRYSGFTPEQCTNIRNSFDCIYDKSEYNSNDGICKRCYKENGNECIGGSGGGGHTNVGHPPPGGASRQGD